KNLEHIVSTLLRNNYPIELIFNTINARLKILFHIDTIQQKESSDEIKRDCTSWFVLPYVPKISDEFKRISKTFNTKLAFTSLNKLNSLIKGHKNVLPREKRKNVVYKISCKSCDASYVGQTKRKLKTRLAEHRNHMNRNSNNQSVITEHRIEFDHDFDWENVAILDEERSLNKRLISEYINENADLRALLDENPVQSISELARELNVDRTTVIKCLHIQRNYKAFRYKVIFL
ncbi:hypothetical protein ALC57_17645, partial [Trachymyrmex cornetzi]